MSFSGHNQGQHKKWHYLMLCIRIVNIFYFQLSIWHGILKTFDNYAVTVMHMWTYLFTLNLSNAAFKCIVSGRHNDRNETLCTYMVMTLNICLSRVIWRKRNVILHLNISSPLKSSLNRIAFMFKKHVLIWSWIQQFKKFCSGCQFCRVLFNFHR